MVAAPVIYQVYHAVFRLLITMGYWRPSGFTEKNDYIRITRVDAIWLFTFFTSPIKTSHMSVSVTVMLDPILQPVDFDQILSAHRHGLKVMIDQVLNHSSDQHPCVCESVEHDNAKASIVCHVNANPDAPFHNCFRICASMALDSRRRQYIFHKTSRQQPDLNFHNGFVSALLETVILV